MTPIVIYHGGCTDGFAAAWAIWKKYPDWEFYPGVYQSDPPDVTDREVWLVDFSYKRPVLLKMAEKAKKIIVLDHHKSAMKDLVNLPSNVKVDFDMDQSGCVLAWKAFHKEPVPEVLLDIQDRDLWKKERPFNDEITMAIRSYEQTFETYSYLVENRELLINEGTAISRYYFQQVHDLVEAWRRTPIFADIGKWRVPVINTNYFMASEVAGILAENQPFAACYWHTANSVTYSLRSREDGIDVSEVAVKYGGGGHAGAAGFKVDKRIDTIWIDTEK